MGVNSQGVPTTDKPQPTDFPIIEVPKIVPKNIGTITVSPTSSLSEFESDLLYRYQNNPREPKHDSLITFEDSFTLVLNQFCEMHTPSKFTLSLPDDWTKVEVNISEEILLRDLQASSDLTRTVKFYTTVPDYSGSYTIDGKLRKFEYQHDPDKGLSEEFKKDLQMLHRYSKYREAELSSREQRLIKAVKLMGFTRLISTDRIQKQIDLVIELKNRWGLLAALAQASRFSSSVSPLGTVKTQTISRIMRAFKINHFLHMDNSGFSEYLETLAEFFSFTSLKSRSEPTIDYATLFHGIQTSTIPTKLKPSLLRLDLACGPYTFTPVFQPHLETLMQDQDSGLQAYLKFKNRYISSQRVAESELRLPTIDVSMLKQFAGAMVYDTFFYMPLIKTLSESDRLEVLKHLASEHKLSHEAMLHGLLTGTFAEPKNTTLTNPGRFFAWIEQENYKLVKPWVEFLESNKELFPARWLISVCEFYLRTHTTVPFCFFIELLPTSLQTTIIDTLRSEVMRSETDEIQVLYLNIIMKVERSLAQLIRKKLNWSFMRQQMIVMPLDKLIPLLIFIKGLDDVSNAKYHEFNSIETTIFESIVQNIELLDKFKSQLRILFPHFMDNITPDIHLRKPKEQIDFWVNLNFCNESELDDHFSNPYVLYNMIQSFLDNDLDQSQANFARSLFIKALNTSKAALVFPYFTTEKHKSLALLVQVFKSMDFDLLSALLWHLTPESIEEFYPELSANLVIDKTSASWAALESRREGIARAEQDKMAQRLALPNASEAIAPAPEPAPAPAPAANLTVPSAPMNDDGVIDEPASAPAPAPAPQSPPPRFNESDSEDDEPDLEEKYKTLQAAYITLSLDHERLRGKRAVKQPLDKNVTSELLDEKLEGLKTRLRFSQGSSSSSSMDDKQRIFELEKKLKNSNAIIAKHICASFEKRRVPRERKHSF